VLVKQAKRSVLHFSDSMRTVTCLVQEYTSIPLKRDSRDCSTENTCSVIF